MGLFSSSGEGLERMRSKEQENEELKQKLEKNKGEDAPKTNGNGDKKNGDDKK